MKFYILLIGLVILLASCKSHNIVKIPATKADAGLQELISKMHGSTIEYTWIRTKAHLSYNGNSALATIKMRKDSLVWGSVNLFLELARAEVTKDSAILLNRTQKEYSVFPISRLQAVLGISGLNLISLQRLMMAIPPFDLNFKYSLEKRENDYKLTCQEQAFKEEYILEASTLRMKEYYYKKNESQKLRIIYEDFEHVGNLILPKKIKFEIESPEKKEVFFEVTEYTLPATDEAPFNIPSSYHKQ